MRILVIADIHSNLVALEAVLHHTDTYEAVWCLGDIVGYGPDPNGCVERVRSLPNLVCLAGNHDKAVLNEIDIRLFNEDARAAISWTQTQISERALEFLRACPQMEIQGDFCLAHGSPRRPVWEYIISNRIARDNFAAFDTPWCLVGHTHTPIIYQEIAPGECREELPDYRRPRYLDSERLIINPGSVGQPRDHNPDAAYAILDTEQGLWEYRRAPYDIHLVQEQMRAAALPERLISRLTHGY